MEQTRNLLDALDDMLASAASTARMIAECPPAYAGQERRS